MKPHNFSFRSVWTVPVSLIVVWDSIGRVTEYPQWWKGIAHVELLKGPELPVTVGSRAKYIVKSPLYSLQYETEVVEYDLGKYILAKSTGDLEGTGKWIFSESDKGTEAIFEWNVSVTNPKLQFVSRLPFVRIMMGVFHNQIMSQGQAGLRQLLSMKDQVTPDVMDGEVA